MTLLGTSPIGSFSFCHVVSKSSESLGTCTTAYCKPCYKCTECQEKRRQVLDGVCKPVQIIMVEYSAALSIGKS
jgi:hypothetical protein